MSREEIERAISEVCLILRPPNDALISCRQLAVGVTKRLLADERERVREMCAVEAQQMRKAVVDYYWPKIPPHLFKFLDERLQTIRQLDLTKDEGKGGEQ